jgi:hypothetical protein
LSLKHYQRSKNKLDMISKSRFRLFLDNGRDSAKASFPVIVMIKIWLLLGSNSYGLTI